jgi:hypothetical protein
MRFSAAFVLKRVALVERRVVKGKGKCHRQAGSKSDSVGYRLRRIYLTAVICAEAIPSAIVAFS